MDTPYNINSVKRLQTLIFFRIVTVSFLLTIAAVIQLKGTKSLFQASLYPVFSIIAITYLLSLIYVFSIKRIKNIIFNVELQAFIDVVLVTVLVYVTGGIESFYTPLYPCVIIYSVLFLGRKGGLLLASICGVFYGLLLDLEFYRIIPSYLGELRGYNAGSGYVFARIFIHIVSFYVVAFLTSFVVEGEKRAIALLSEKKDAFDQLDSLHRSIIESVNTGIMTVDLHNSIKTFNRTAEEITGFDLLQIRDRKLEDIFPTLNIADEHDGNNRSVRFETVFTAAEGDKKILGFSCSSLLDVQQNCIGTILIFQDLTIIREMEKAVEQNKRLALIGEMAAILAHELRNPLTSISGSIQLLQNDLDLDGTNEKLMQIIVRGKEQLEKLVRNFLFFARPASHERRRINIHYILEEITFTIRFEPDWNDDVRIEMAECEHDMVYGCETEIRQILWNILLNALQAMPDGGNIKIATKRVDNGGDQTFVKIRIQDSGCGIDQESKKKIFEPFYTTKEKGTGLGLPIVRKIIENHGGIFTVESEPGRGTTCSIQLPVIDSVAYFEEEAVGGNSDC